METHTCSKCGKSFMRYGHPKYCSTGCYADSSKGKPKRKWGKDSYINHDGYKLIRVSGSRRFKMEHRLVMEAHLGRPLLEFPFETIHHINGDKLDNRIENLQIVEGGQAEHIRKFHAKRFRSATHAQCTRCMRIKPRSEFYTDAAAARRGKDTHATQCKECGRKKAMDYRRRTNTKYHLDHPKSRTTLR